MWADKEKLKKLIIIAVAAVMVLTLIAYVLTVVLEHVRDSINDTHSTPKNDVIVFPPADYDENIFEDAIYMMFDRSIKFTQDGYGITLTEDELENFGAGAKLFYDYFNTVINGRYEEYPEFFSDRYKNDIELPEKFTMQKIYDIDIRLYSREQIDDSDKTYLETYEVRYKIRSNNGTLRNDVESDTTKPIVFELIVDDTNKTAVIDDIYPVITIDVPEE